MQRTHIVFLPVVFLHLSCTAAAATYTVKAAAGGHFTTIQACANVAVAGDTCEIYAGTYAESVTVPASGSPGLPITFRAASGESVRLPGFTLANRSHIVLGGPTSATGLEITGNSPTIALSNTTHITIQNNYIHDSTTICIRCLYDTTSSYVTIQGNTITRCAHEAIQLRGDHHAVQNNAISHVTDFVVAYWVSDSVVRGNTFGPTSPGGSYHIDGVQSNCGTRLLLEGNTITDIDIDDSHFSLHSGPSVGVCGNQAILRLNLFKNMGGPYTVISQVSSTPNVKIYNNTAANIGLRLNGWTTFNFQGTPNGAVINNILYNAVRSGGSGYGVDSASQPGFVGKNNLAYNTSCGTTCSWAAPIGTEGGGVRNQDPLFVSSSDYHLQSGSPARGAGTFLTTVAHVDAGSGTSLVVGDAALFQDGMNGIVSADWIRVGSTTTVQIASINYSSNTITLTNSISRSAGAPVYLYRDSSGTVVLNGANPDIGAFQYGAPARPAPPTNLRSTVH